MTTLNLITSANFNFNLASDLQKIDPNAREYWVDSTGGVINITLPKISNDNDLNRTLTFVRKDGGGNNVNLNSAAGDTIKTPATQIVLAVNRKIILTPFHRTKDYIPQTITIVL